MRCLPKLALAGALITSASAATIGFVGVPTGVNDGQYYVTPYEITIDGAPTMVTCYDVYDDVNFGDVWQANILTLAQASAAGYFSGSGGLAGYERVAWLDNQTYANTDQQVGLQHAMWNVFGSVSSPASALAYEAAADTAAAGNYAGFDFSKTRFIEQVGGVPGQAGTKQAFVYEDTAIGSSDQGVVTPEPGTLILFAGAALLLLGTWSTRSTRVRQAVPPVLRCTRN